MRLSCQSQLPASESHKMLHECVDLSKFLCSSIRGYIITEFSKVLEALLQIFLPFCMEEIDL